MGKKPTHEQGNGFNFQYGWSEFETLAWHTKRPGENYKNGDLSD